MNAFISCDWGTSNFRLQLVSIPELKIIAKVETNEGIAGIYKSWQAGNENRFLFYRKILLNNIHLLEKQADLNLSGYNIIISGMASASIGMIELPYKECPVSADGRDFILQHIKADSACRHEIYIVSGIRTRDDVLRGEETLIAGCDLDDAEEEQLFILPGTHSKHIVVKNKCIESFKTFMTGEFFDLLSNKSVLSASVKQDKQTAENNSFFLEGVHQATKGSLLHNAFLVRTNQLLKNFDAGNNYEYLSGLVIGAELIEIPQHTGIVIKIISNGVLCKKYLLALQSLSLTDKTMLQNSEELLLKGQFNIIKTLHDGNKKSS